MPTIPKVTELYTRTSKKSATTYPLEKIQRSVTNRQAAK